MLRGSAQSPKPVIAVSVYAQMEKGNIHPDNYTFPFLLKACTKLSWARTGLAVHGKAVRFGFGKNTFLRNTLIYFHANCGDIRIACDLFDSGGKREVVAWSALTAGYARRGELAAARKLFDEMPVKDLISWNVMITGYAKRGEMESARELFDEMPKRDVVTWNAVISGYVLYGAHKRAVEMFEKMVNSGEKPDDVTMLSLLSACADSGDLSVGEKLHFSMLEMFRGDLSVVIGNALIDMYAKCGNIERAFDVFRKMREKDRSSWNSIICGLAFHGHSAESLSLFEEMTLMKIRPNEVTFVGVLIACSHVGNVKRGHAYFSMMSERYDIEPNIKHYGCMVDLLGRAGKLKEAFEFIDKMEIEPNAIIWRTLLGACRTHGNVELGKRVNEELLKLRRDHSGDYVLLSNIYASQGEWNGVETVRRMMDESGVIKEAGCSLVEADDKALLHFLVHSKPDSNKFLNHYK